MTLVDISNSCTYFTVKLIDKPVIRRNAAGVSAWVSAPAREIVLRAGAGQGRIFWMLLAATIKQRAREAGFDLVGIAPPSALSDLEFLPQWLDRGFGGEIRYLADARRRDPRQILPSVKSIVCLALLYNTAYPFSTELSRKPEQDEREGDADPRGWISRYAWGRDYHTPMRGKLEQLRTAIEKLAPGAETRVYVDTGPIVERAFARLSGIGWMGKNTCLINERQGSWFFLGVILTSLELGADLPAPDRCGSCTRCLEACPTGALTEPYVMDASRCISYFNIELRGAIPKEYRTAIGRNVFGCDICQDVCPWNNRPGFAAGDRIEQHGEPVRTAGPGAEPKRPGTTGIPEFQPMRIETSLGGQLSDNAAQADGAHQPPASEPFSLFNPLLESLASITESDFRRVFAQSPIKRAKYRGWLRNLCVVMGNSGDCRFIPWLETAAENSDPVVREHAAWALRQLRSSASA